MLAAKPRMGSLLLRPRQRRARGVTPPVERPSGMPLNVGATPMRLPIAKPDHMQTVALSVLPGMAAWQASSGHRLNEIWS
jgi:hypothetical protein